MYPEIENAGGLSYAINIELEKLTKDLPSVTAVEYAHFVMSKGTTEYAKISQTNSIPNSKIYVVTKNKTQYIGEGNASEALKIVLESLPKEIEPARKGTAND